MITFNEILAQYSILTWGSGIIFIILLSQTVLIFFLEKYFPRKKMLKYNQIILDIFNVIGVIYAILYGLLTFFVLNNFQQIENTLNAEVSTIGNIYRNISLVENENNTKPLQQQIYKYVEIIIYQELPYQKKGIINVKFELPGWNKLETISRMILKQPMNEFIKSKLIDNLNDLYQNRRDRLNSSTLQLPNVIWIVTALSILFMLMNLAIVGCSTLKSKIISAYLLGISVGLMVILVAVIDRPFVSGDYINDQYYRNLLAHMVNLYGKEYFGLE